MKQALSGKCHSNSKIVLVEDNEIIPDDMEVAEILDYFFVKVTELLNNRLFKAQRA